MRLYNCTLETIDNKQILFNNWSYGFYSNTFQSFVSLLVCLNHGIVPDRIDHTRGFFHFKKDSTTDLYPIFYKLGLDQLKIPIKKNLYLPDANRISVDEIKLYNYNDYTNILNCFFSPVDEIMDIKNDLIKKYNINFEKTIAVFYRGTDKDTELTIPKKEYVMDYTKKLLERYPDCRVLIQTDETQCRDYFKNELQEKCFYFDEAVTTETKTVTWRIIYYFSESDPTLKAQIFDAIVRIIADCKYVINHTGNCGAFVDLYRGNMVNTFKYDGSGNFIVNI